MLDFTRLNDVEQLGYLLHGVGAIPHDAGYEAELEDVRDLLELRIVEAFAAGYELGRIEG